MDYRDLSSSLNNQATMSDKVVGLLMLLVAALAFFYYTVWVVVLVSPECAY